MSKKKSYMNKENILAEGFFSKLGKMLGLSSKQEKLLKKDPKIKSALKDYNDGWSDIEDYVRDFTGDQSFKLSKKKFTISDFI